jgi:hypothetical protein
MKKMALILGIAFLSGIALSSCKKEYTCNCTASGGSTATYTYKDTKKNAKEICDEWEADAGFGLVWTCELE